MGVLIVDDSKFMRNILVDIFNRNKIAVLGEASDGKEAIKTYIELKPKVTTMDLTMKGMNGVEAIKEIISIDPKAYIIVCSAMGQQAFVKEALKAGAKGFVVKPFDEEDIVSEVNKGIKFKNDNF